MASATREVGAQQVRSKSCFHSLQNPYFGRYYRVYLNYYQPLKGATVMKKNIHPELHDVTAHCACGATFESRSTRNDITVTFCSACHPVYTGKQKFVDTAGRIEKFQSKFGKTKK